MRLIDLKEIFILRSGNKFDANKMEFVKDEEINFISRDSKNNGCVGTVKKYKNVEPFSEGLITVSLGGSFLLSSFLQPKKFYTAQNVTVLVPRKEMSVEEKLYYCNCISLNRFRYSAFGREANKTLKFLKVPEKVPKWVRKLHSFTIPDIKSPLKADKISLRDRKMQSFRIEKIFDVKKGNRMVVSKYAKEGICPFVSAIDKNNGIRYYLDLKPNHQGNTITVSYNGSIGEAFYQPESYWATDDINVLYPKFELNSFLAMFLITLIRKERYRFSFGRKWHKERMEKSTIKLPVDRNGNPDWKFMEDYIKSLEYSKEFSKVIA